MEGRPLVGYPTSVSSKEEITDAPYFSRLKLREEINISHHYLEMLARR